MPATLCSLARIVRQPVLPITRESLKATWGSLPEAFRTPQQMLGRQGNPCGATIGAMPRCDFACRGCYLGEEANHVPALGVEAIKAQMRQLRPALGDAGNLQITDGEVTLRPEEELIDLIRYAQEIRLVPMLMTHGDSFRRRPGLLERLMVEGGLREVTVHVDTTMRGRKGAAYKQAATEAELNSLREEFADMIRTARRTTGRPLIGATTMTVTRDNLAGVPDVVRCTARNADCFKILSFQPIAQVGRTEDGLGGGVEVEELWRLVAQGLAGPAADPDYLWRARMWLGHHECNRYVHGFMVTDGGGEASFQSLRLEGDAVDERAVEEYMRIFGGVSFRLDTPAEKAARALGVFLRSPSYWLGTGFPYFWHLVKRFDPRRPARLLWRLLRGQARAAHFIIVSHHFMSRAQIETPLGRERLDLCVFRVPVGGRLVGMCEVNAMGVRERFYERLLQGGDTTLPLTEPDGRPHVLLGRTPAAGRRELRVVS